MYAIMRLPDDCIKEREEITHRYFLLILKTIYSVFREEADPLTRSGLWASLLFPDNNYTIFRPGLRKRMKKYSDFFSSRRERPE